MKKVKVLLIGIGGYGANYMKELTEKNVTSVRLEGICEVSENVIDQYPAISERGISVYQTPEEFYREHDADLAIISTPIHLHYQQIQICLRNGSNVLTEKPLCATVKGALELRALEQETGHFVSVGFQLNYSRDVLELKKDILCGDFGRPVLFKAIHGISRGERYYQRNSWAGRIAVDGCMVNDSPFNNACAHQFQNMTFLLGKRLDQAAEIGGVQAELYRANQSVENFDTVALCAKTEDGIPLYYYTTHALSEKKLGPISEFIFEAAVVYFGKDYGDGPVLEYVAEMGDGTIRSYGSVNKGDRLQKLYDAIECTLQGGHPVSTIQCALPHLEVVNALTDLPIYQIREDKLEYVEADGDWFCRIRNLKDIYETCYKNHQLPSEMGISW